MTVCLVTHYWRVKGNYASSVSLLQGCGGQRLVTGRLLCKETGKLLCNEIRRLCDVVPLVWPNKVLCVLSWLHAAWQNGMGSRN